MADQENRQFTSGDNIQPLQSRVHPPPPTRPPPLPPSSPSSAVSPLPFPPPLSPSPPSVASLTLSSSPPRGPPNHLDINFSWEKNSRGDSHSEQSLPSRRSNFGLLASFTSFFGGAPKSRDKIIPSIPSYLQYGPSEPIHGIEYRLIRRFHPNSTMPQQSSFIYMDKDAVHSILSTLKHLDSDQMEIYLHTQLSLVAGAPRSCQETSVSGFLDWFMEPTVNIALAIELREYWWSLECTLPNGVIIIHSLAPSMYDNVYIFKFSPVTGVFCKLVPQEVSDMRAFLFNHPHNPKFFHRIMSNRQLSDHAKNRGQQSIGMSSAAKSMTNLANTVGRRLSGSSINNMSTDLLNGIKNNIIPTLMKWNKVQDTCPTSSSRLTAHPNITSPDISQRGAENKPNSFPTRRPGFLRSASATYIRHPLQTLRHHGSSVSVLSTRTSEEFHTIKTPCIVLTTPEQNTAILKLSAFVPQGFKGKEKSFWQSLGETITPKKPETPTFVFWKDVFDQICFDVRHSHKISSYPVELDTNIHNQVTDNLNRLLVGITDMYVKETGGMQLDFIRMKILSDEEAYQAFNVRMYQRSRRATGHSAFSDLFPPRKENVSLNAEGPHGGIGEPTAEEIRRQGRVLANNTKPDQKVELNLSSEELEFSSVLLSQDTYLVEAVLAAWFADASEWMKESGLRWRNMLFDRQAAGGPGGLV
ncbi:hypothetical protein AOL_s00007g317 [Orbilia oligospora ATCC 24927]|uniref:Uncharacterized protein n=2 Tax=Orbilia oligospora TaxID=2813651 RepID=G1X208_ARTOA|nr:hypothetical protein AOL_s00007g317 [Orbilia oligospora ATCC 24927]EGX52981.1 hypothetical protein AOL_s00007g317 [Orbilia oligospora ATCC 24927]KAF3277484.1 hypothetical protein TWF970_005093 [Orbilia oligospora]